MKLNATIRSLQLAVALCCCLSPPWGYARELGESSLLLKPTLNQAISTYEAVSSLQQDSYAKLPPKKKVSSKILDSYFKALDPNRSFFLGTDIEQFKHYRQGLDIALGAGNLKPAFVLFERYRQRSHERIAFMLAQIDKGIEKLDFRKDEQLILDRSELAWPKNKTEQEQLWLRQLKESVLAMKLNDKNLQQIKKSLTKRFKKQRKRLSQMRDEDVVQLYLNAYTQLYDPHTQYFSPQRAENFDINMSLSLEGIGAVLKNEDELVKVVSIVPEGPADREGHLKPGDAIVGIGQGRQGKMEDVVGMRLDEVVDLIRGRKGSRVRIEVVPALAAKGKNRIYTIVRDRVTLKEQSARKEIIELKERHKRIGILDIPAFYLDFKAAEKGGDNYKSTTRDVRKLIAELKKERIDGIVVDLRNNGGGSLQEANELAGLFIEHGPTVIVKDSRGHTQIEKDPDPKIVYAGPLVVLINRLSASSSEIFAGAMQDYQRALIVGGQSFGKGTVQAIKPLRSGLLKFTIAKFYRVSGRSTQHRGVTPDLLFPSLFDGRQIGESTLSNALSYSEIAPVQFRPLAPLKQHIPALQQAHALRVEKNPDFVYMNRLIEYQKKHGMRTEVTLHEEKRKKEVTEVRNRLLAIENSLRVAKGKKPFKNSDEMEAEEDREMSATDSQYKPQDDAQLVEASHILADLIDRTKGKKASVQLPGG